MEGEVAGLGGSQGQDITNNSELEHFSDTKSPATINKERYVVDIS